MHSAALFRHIHYEDVELAKFCSAVPAENSQHGMVRETAHPPVSRPPASLHLAKRRIERSPIENGVVPSHV